MIVISQASDKDKKDFAQLIILSAQYFPELFGNNIEQILQKIFPLSSHLFSYEHVIKASVNNVTAGIILSYSWVEKNNENLKTGLLLLKNIGLRMFTQFHTFLRLNSTLGHLNEKEYYISNLAVYPQFRGQGIGKQLMMETEKKAQASKADKICLDVEADNHIAIGLYKKLGYHIIEKFKVFIHRQEKVFFRMQKSLIFT